MTHILSKTLNEQRIVFFPPQQLINYITASLHHRTPVQHRRIEDPNPNNSPNPAAASQSGLVPAAASQSGLVQTHLRSEIWPSKVEFAGVWRSQPFLKMLTATADASMLHYCCIKQPKDGKQQTCEWMWVNSGFSHLKCQLLYIPRWLPWRGRSRWCLCSFWSRRGTNWVSGAAGAGITGVCVSPHPPEVTNIPTVTQSEGRAEKQTHLFLMGPLKVGSNWAGSPAGETSPLD